MRYLVGIVIGLTLGMMFPKETQEGLGFLKDQIRAGAEFVVAKTEDDSLVDKFK
jgi:hypothetical protein